MGSPNLLPMPSGFDGASTRKTPDDGHDLGYGYSFDQIKNTGGPDDTVVRVGHAQERHGDDGSFSWASDDGHIVDISPGGGVRIETASGSVYTREPGGEVMMDESNRQVAGDRSYVHEDSDGTFRFDDGHGNSVSITANGQTHFGREDGGGVRSFIQRSEDGVVLDSRPTSSEYTLENSNAGFPRAGTGTGELEAGGVTLKGGGFEMASHDGDVVRWTPDGDYYWTDDAGKFLAYDGASGELTLQNANGDWRTMQQDGSGDEGNVYGEKPSTNWPDYDVVVGYSDGIRQITDPNGGVASSNAEGDFDLQRADGGSLYRDSGSGEMVKITSDGTWVLADPDNDNDHIVGHLAIDGPPPVGQGALEKDALSARDADKRETRDGAEITTYGDGTEYTKFADGSSEYRSDGNVVRTDAEGNIRFRGPDVDSGRATVDDVAAGTLLNSDGLPDAVTAEVRDEFNLTGEVSAGAGGGFGIGGGFTERRYEGGGTRTTYHDEGTVEIDDGEGRTRTLRRRERRDPRGQRSTPNAGSRPRPRFDARAERPARRHQPERHRGLQPERTTVEVGGLGLEPLGDGFLQRWQRHRRSGHRRDQPRGRRRKLAPLRGGRHGHRRGRARLGRGGLQEGLLRVRMILASA